MKHKIIKLISLLGVLLFCFVSGQEVKADVDYDIAKNITTAKVNSDGSLTMKRAITYKFNSSALEFFIAKIYNRIRKSMMRQ